MQADWQSIMAYVVLAAAVGYALLGGWRAVRAKSGCAYPGGGCGAPESKMLGKKQVLTPMGLNELDRGGRTSDASSHE